MACRVKGAYHQGQICNFGITKPPSCSITRVMMTLHRVDIMLLCQKADILPLAIAEAVMEAAQTSPLSCIIKETACS